MVRASLQVLPRPQLAGVSQDAGSSRSDIKLNIKAAAVREKSTE